MNATCHQTETPSCHGGGGRKKFDYLLWISLSIVAGAYLLHLSGATAAFTFTSSVFELMNRMWWGLVLGITFVGMLSKVPREFVMSVMGKAGTVGGIFRATLAGMMLDLCSHGILLVGMKLYERGASLGQLIAFLVASPWNSFSLTVILISLIGLKWTLLFIIGSCVIAIISGIIFDRLVAGKVLPDNPNETSIPEDFRFWQEAKSRLKRADFNREMFGDMLMSGVKESRMILRWIFFGVVLASLIRTFMPTDQFATYFGPTLMGLGLTIIAATIIEVCSEGSAPIAADILNRAGAPGNSFAFLMTGVSTDYTEIMALKETTGSWKISLFLPLVTVPQVILLSWVINQF